MLIVKQCPRRALFQSPTGLLATGVVISAHEEFVAYAKLLSIRSPSLRLVLLRFL